MTTEGAKPVIKYHVEYIGGHSIIPKKQKMWASLLKESLKLEGGIHNLDIPYWSIKIENATAEHITKTRVFLASLIGLIWKRKYLYTVIDCISITGEENSIVIDFHR